MPPDPFKMMETSRTARRPSKLVKNSPSRTAKELRNTKTTVMDGEYLNIDSASDDAEENIKALYVDALREEISEQGGSLPLPCARKGIIARVVAAAIFRSYIPYGS